MEYLKKEMDLFIAYDEVDFLGRIKMSAVAQHYQSILEKHADELDISHYQMKARGKFWVLSRMKTVIDYYPKVDSKISALTYPHLPGSVEAQRSFYLLDENRRPFTHTISKWCILDLETRKMVRGRQYLKYPDEVFSPEKALEFSPRSLERAVDGDSGKCGAARDFTVNTCDLDLNQHMNNTKYYDTILNMCSIEELKNKEVAMVDLSFLSELKIGESYRVLRTDDGDMSRFEGVCEGRRVFSALVEWRKVSC